MVNKYFDGLIAEPSSKDAMDDELISLALATTGKVEKNMDEYKAADALYEIVLLLKRSNKYIDETQPWILAKEADKKDRLATVLYNLLESIRIASVLLTPFIPDTAAEIQRQINTTKTDWDSLKTFDGTIAGTRVNAAKPLFARIDEEKKLAEIAAMKEEAEQEKERKAEEEDAKYITIDDFEKLDLRVAKVLECEKVEGSNKLLKLQLEVGSEKRQVVSGIAKYYKPEDLIGKSVVLVANLKPVKLKGIESKGMILAASNDEELTVITPLTEIKSGSQVS
jgi:methionyl-tRNA synthetase